MEKTLDIYGIRTVIEAIKAGDKTIDKIFIQIGLKGGLINELEALIRQNKLKYFLCTITKTKTSFQKEITKG